MLIHSNQTSASIDRRGHSDQDTPLSSIKSCTEMRRVISGRNRNGGIGVNPPRTIGNISPQVTWQGRFNFFNIIMGMLYFSDMSASWYGVEISESKNPEDDSIFKYAWRENNSEVEKVGR